MTKAKYKTTHEICVDNVSFAVMRVGTNFYTHQDWVEENGATWSLDSWNKLYLKGLHRPTASIKGV